MHNNNVVHILAIFLNEIICSELLLYSKVVLAVEN